MLNPFCNVCVALRVFELRGIGLDSGIFLASRVAIGTVLNLRQPGGTGLPKTVVNATEALEQLLCFYPMPHSSYGDISYWTPVVTESSVTESSTTL